MADILVLAEVIFLTILAHSGAIVSWSFHHHLLGRA